MYGLNAIEAHNGWAISVVGITIVFTGLMLLSIAISQIHKLLDLWERRDQLDLFGKKKKSLSETEPQKPPVVLTPVQKESARQFRLLAGTLDDPFSLPRLLKMAEVSGVALPHTTLARLLKADIIIADGNGFHTWNTDTFNTLMS